MSKWSETIERHRPGLLAVIMGVLLLFCVGLAGWLVVARGGASQEGVEVLQDIREKKLPAFWGEEAVSLWYLYTDPNGKAVGWWTRTRGPAGKGYQGKRIEQVGSSFLREVWQVDRTGRISQYLARASAIVRRPGTRIPLLQPISTTSILLRDGQVEVRQTGLQITQAAKASAPGNYIPEGLNDLAYYQASLDERRAAFTLVINDAAVNRGRLHFTSITVVPEGRGKVLLSTQIADGDAKERLEFDSKGEVLRGGSPGGRYSFERSTFDLVKKAFPEVELFVRREAEDSQVD